MSVSFLDATAALLTGLLDNIWTGSWKPGVNAGTGSLVEIIGLS